MKKIFIFVLFLSFFLGSCRHFFGRHVHGNGNGRTEERSITAFRDLDVSSTIDVHIVKGELKPVSIHADENLLQYIEVLQEGDRLIIRNRHDYDLESSEGMSITVTSPSFHQISLSGAGDIVSDDKIKGDDDLEIELSGAGNIRMDVDVPKFTGRISGAGSLYIKGQTKDVEVDVSGVGSAHCYDLQAENVRAEVSGVGSADVFSSVKIDASVNGVGSIHYKGNPTEVNQHVSGVGSVNKEN
jgi:hypothetical protein